MNQLLDEFKIDHAKNDKWRLFRKISGRRYA
jgi:hypothetical protein